ncbi:MAG: tetratricopeptide repeat protein [Treponema sp.]|nr:tetratricopeptide repeat protein [Treponema sp.]
MAASAEEYYSIGMAYFEIGKYEEAEKWLNRARQAKRTMTASTYNLGRIAFERQRYEEAARHFESVLKSDPDNVLALKAAAYARIRNGDIEIAERHYAKLLTIVPESADDGYNHALVLYAMGRYSAAEEVLQRYPIAMQDNMDVVLLYARCQAAQNNVEAINNYSTWLSNTSTPNAKVRYEYAQVLERNGLYARAIEEYRLAHTEAEVTAVNPAKCDIRFAIGRALLIADRDSAEGVTEMQGAVTDGFKDVSAVEELLRNNNISASVRDNLRRNVFNSLLNPPAPTPTTQETGN